MSNNRTANDFSCPGFRAARMSRRRLLQVGGAGLLGLNMHHVLHAAESSVAPRARAKSVIFLYQFGGPSHIDMFDMKPDAPDAIRGPHRPIGRTDQRALGGRAGVGSVVLGAPAALRRRRAKRAPEWPAAASPARRHEP